MDNFQNMWMKPGKVDHIHFIGKDVIAVGVGCYIQFYELLTHKELYYHAINKDKGDGIQCVAGHRNMPIFAFSEKCINPRVIICSYPEFSHLSILKDESNTHGYLKIFFAEMEYLITVSSYPGSSVILWNWRRCEQLASHDAGILHTNIFIRYSVNIPIAFSIISENSKIINIWEVHICPKNNFFMKNDIVLPDQSTYPCYFTWTPEHTLLVTDNKGNIYMINPDILKVQLVLPYYDSEGRDTNPCIMWHKGGIVVTYPDSIVKYFKYSGGSWTESWTVKVEWTVLMLFANKEIALAVNSKYELLQLNVEDSIGIHKIKSYKHSFCTVAIIYPAGDILATLDNDRCVELWDLDTGHILSQFRSNLEYLTMSSSPTLPFLGLGRADGIIDFLNVYNSKEPCLLTQAFLSKNKIQIIKFSTNNDMLVAADKTTGEFFLLQVLVGNKIDVICYENIKTKIVDLIILEAGRKLNVLILTGTEDCLYRGDKIIIYELSGSGDRFESPMFLQLFGQYTGIAMCPHVRMRFFAIPQLSKQIHEIEVRQPYCKVVKAWLSGHQLGNMFVISNNSNFLTYGTDGIVFMNIQSSETLIYVLHHRSDGGVKMAVINSSSNYVVSLGHDGSLICISIRKKSDDKNEEQDKSPAMKLNFTTKKTVGIIKTSWLDRQAHATFRREQQDNKVIKGKIKEDFKDIQKKLRALLDKNDQNTPEERLPIDMFDLDCNAREEKLKKAAEERSNRQAYLISKCRLQDELCTKLKEQFWDSMEVKCKALMALTQSLSVDSYPVMFKDLKFEKELKQINFQRLIEMGSQVDKLEPWKSKIRHPSNMQSSKEDNESGTMLLSETVSDIHEEDNDPAVEDGSISHKFIELSPYLYSQFEIATFSQMQYQSILLTKVTNDLREYFNKKFQDAVSFKITQMNLITEKNNRLRYILSELKDTKTFITDPEWRPEENPETIMKVEPKEVSITPYISPSQQAILDQLAAEEEARRLAELADNFRELALIEMMDGVLEVRWEDLIKRDIPIPKCMIEKKPEEYNEDDLKTIKEYHEKVEFLMSERERYKKMLEQEFKKLTQTVKETTENLDSHISEIYKLKLLVESAIDQEIFKILKYRYIAFQRQKLMMKEHSILQKVQENEQLIIYLQNILSKLQVVGSECRALYDNLVARDQFLDKNFKKEFSDVQAVVVEQLYKTFRRRPKQKVLESKQAVNNLLYAMTSMKSTYMTSETKDFINALDAMDNYSNAAGTVNEETWNTLCRLRRTKIESELKVKAQNSDNAEVDATIHNFQKRISKTEKHQAFLKNELDEIRKEMLKFVQNTQIQLVMKQGLVEITINGKTEDFKDAVMISRSHVESINDEIKKAGNVKLKVMRDTSNFRRVILQTEWEHKRMIMEIEDLKDHLHSLDTIKVTRDMQMYYRQKDEGRTEDRGLLLEREIQLVRETFDRAVNNIEKQINDVEQSLQQKTKENKILDKQIIDLNVDVNEQQLQRNLAFETATEESAQKRMMYILKRSHLARKIQDQHNKIMMLQTELELLRLKTYPTLKYKTLF